MTRIGKAIQITAAATLLAATITVLLALPGFLSDLASTVPIRTSLECGR